MLIFNRVLKCLGTWPLVGKRQFTQAPSCFSFSLVFQSADSTLMHFTIHTRQCLFARHVYLRWQFKHAFGYLPIVEPLRQSSDHEDSEGEPQVYAKGVSFEEDREGQKTAEVTKKRKAVDDAQAGSSKSRRVAWPKEACASSADEDSVFLKRTLGVANSNSSVCRCIRIRIYIYIYIYVYMYIIVY